MIKFIIFCFISLQIFASDSIVAVVNDDVILKSELLNDLQLLRKNTPSIPNNPKVLAKLLDQRILHILQLQKVKEFNIRPTERMLSNKINSIAKQNKMLLKDLKKTLNSAKKNGFQEFVNDIKRTLSLEILKQNVIQEKNRVTEQEVAIELNAKNLALYNYTIRNITVAKNKEGMKKISLIYKLLKNKKQTFKQLAKSFSESLNAKDYGNMGTLNISKIPRIYKRTLSKLKIGEISKVIRDKDFYHIIKLEDKKTIKPQLKKQFYIRHILVSIEKHKNAKEIIDKVYKKLMKNNNIFPELAKEFSDDLYSKNKNGVLGWLDYEKIHPEFIKNLKDNNISKPFKTEFGWHIAQKTKEREVNTTIEEQKKEIKQNLKQKKSIQIYSDWLESVRNNAYIKKYLNNL